MKVLIADVFGKATMDSLAKEGFQITYDSSLEKDKLTAALSKVQPTVLVVRSTKVPAQMIDTMTSVKLIIRAGSGVDNIDVKHASSKGILVSNCPGMNAVAVAELVMGLILSVDRRIPENVQLMKEGKWRKGEFVKQPGIYGRTLGCLGFGFVAQEVALRAKAFGMKVITFTIPLIPEDLTRTGATSVNTVEELFSQSDIITIHVPKTKSTLRMVNTRLLSLMKPGAVLVNTARGDLVQTADMEAKLKSDKKFWYASDVHDGEPSAKKADFPPSALVKCPNFYGTHHIGAGTLQAERAVGEEAGRVIRVFNKTGRIDDKNWVNKTFMPKL